MDENLQQSEVSVIPAETAPVKRKFPKKKLKAILPAAIIILCAVAAIIINTNRPINRFDHALKAGEYDVASAIYEQNSSDEKFVAKTIEKVSSLYLTKTIYSVLLCLIFIFWQKEYLFWIKIML